MGYRTVDARFWIDNELRELKPLVRYVALYLLTNPHSHLSGLYYLPESVAVEESGLGQIPYRRGIDTLSIGYPKCQNGVRFCAYDITNCVVWVRNMFRFQGHGVKHQRAAANQVFTLSKSFLANAFIAYYPEIAPLVPSVEPIPYRYPIDTLSTFGTPDPDPEQELNKNTMRTDVRCVCFDTWWETYRDGIKPRPMRDKTACRKLWGKENWTEKQQLALVAKLEEQIAARKQHHGKTFVPNLPDPIRYLKRRLWTEELDV